ncbi:hypothetical protein N7466_000692 [Penicillium verhagenii]|uniref:uncharacterized protein n=1 Tax=Penicillium verhagenii TaxID=1562060 RepID=UPI0025458B32|nr:uncharacterized protein N7466_000692 [Penicillium verhagenii]KAJ5947677.1 hypothetical protein N7466_000692 [Penicillium verhagenii]
MWPSVPDTLPRACKQACKESHDHQCNCSSQPRPAPAKKSELKEDEASRIQRLVEDLEKAAIAGEFSRRPPPRHGPGNKRNIPAKQGLGGPQYPRRNGGRKNFFREQTLPSPSNNAQIADNRQKWQEFANGGAKVMDDHMNTLARATDPNSEAVKHAVSSLEKSLLPRNYWPLKESLELEKQGVLEGLPKTEEQLKPQQPSESQQSETPTKPEVPQGNLIDLD